MKFSLFCAALLFAGCNGDDGDADTDVQVDTASVVEEVTFARLQQEVFMPSCAGGGCHGGDAANAAGGLSLDGPDAYEHLFNAPCTHPLAVAAGLVRIAPGDVSNSYLFMRITEDDPDGLGSLMPPFLSGLSPEESALIEQWIREGAKP